MGTAALVISIMTLGVQLLQNTTDFINALHSVHNHTSAVVYRHVLKPVGKGAKKAVKKVNTGDCKKLGKCSRCGHQMYEGLVHQCPTAPKSEENSVPDVPDYYFLLEMI
jgi:hypothetical protein